MKQYQFVITVRDRMRNCYMLDINEKLIGANIQDIIESPASRKYEYDNKYGYVYLDVEKKAENLTRAIISALEDLERLDSILVIRHISDFYEDGKYVARRVNIT